MTSDRCVIRPNMLGLRRAVCCDAEVILLRVKCSVVLCLVTDLYNFDPSLVSKQKT